MDSKSEIKKFRGLGTLLICVSAFISFLLATSVDMSHYELGALINYFWPPIIGLCTLILFIVTTFLTRNLNVVKILLVICCMYNLYIGIAFHFEKGNWPLVNF